MSRGIALKSLIALAILALLYSVFWFFIAGQIEKKIHNFVRNNSENISIGEVGISGFPFSQTVSIQDLKFTIPNQALDKRQIEVSAIEAESGVFSNDFLVAVAGEISINNLDGTSVGYVEFTQNPEIKLTLHDGLISHFVYTDSGYNILNDEKISIYLASSSDISFQSSKKKDGSIHNNLTVNIRDIEGFDIVSIYKNVLEKQVIDGIRTGEIPIGSPKVVEVAVVDTPQPDETNMLEENTENLDLEVSTDLIEDTTMAMEDEAAITEAEITTEEPSETIEDAAIEPSTVAQNTPSSPNEDMPILEPILEDEILDEEPLQVQQPASIAEEIEEPLITADTSLKSNLAIDIEYELVPNYADEHDHSDPIHIQRIPTHYTKIMKVSHVTFSNSLYAIAVNGNMHISDDDNMPSGAVTVTVENMHHLVNHLSVGFTTIATKGKAKSETVEDDVKDSQTIAQDAVPTAEEDVALDAIDRKLIIPEYEDAEFIEEEEEEVTQTQDIIEPDSPYQTFLHNITSNLPALSHEMAQKNQLTEDDSAVFDFRREKNIEVLINETPLREILGKL